MSADISSSTGNTCYMNAVFQCLLGLPAFVEELERLSGVVDQRRLSLVQLFVNVARQRRLGTAGRRSQQESMMNFKQAFEQVHRCSLCL
jgi:ubiquitin C-terminal hydrolase